MRPDQNRNFREQPIAVYKFNTNMESSGSPKAVTYSPSTYSSRSTRKYVNGKRKFKNIIIVYHC